MARQPQLKDVIVLDEEKYVIRAIVADEKSIVLTLLEGPNSRTFVLLGAQMNWQEGLNAWRAEDIGDFFETDEVELDSGEHSREVLAAGSGKV